MNLETLKGKKVLLSLIWDSLQVGDEIETTASGNTPHARESPIRGVIGEIANGHAYLWQGTNNGSRGAIDPVTYGYPRSWHIERCDAPTTYYGHVTLRRKRVMKWRDKSLPRVGIDGYAPTGDVIAWHAGLCAALGVPTQAKHSNTILKQIAANKYVESISAAGDTMKIITRAAKVRESKYINDCRITSGWIVKLRYVQGSRHECGDDCYREDDEGNEIDCDRGEDGARVVVTLSERDGVEYVHPNYNGAICFGDWDMECRTNGDIATLADITIKILYGNGLHGFTSWNTYFKGRESAGITIKK